MSCTLLCWSGASPAELCVSPPIGVRRKLWHSWSFLDTREVNSWGKWLCSQHDIISLERCEPHRRTLTTTVTKLIWSYDPTMTTGHVTHATIDKSPLALSCTAFCCLKDAQTLKCMKWLADVLGSGVLFMHHPMRSCYCGNMYWY